MDVAHGEIRALTEVDDRGTRRVCAIVATTGGPLLGVLVAPHDGRDGVIAFRHIARFHEYVYESEDNPNGHLLPLVNDALPRDAAGDPQGTDPNDPRGIRGGAPRRPGMLS